jgi:hypothetical protein
MKLGPVHNFCLLSVMSGLVVVGTGLRAGESAITSAPTTVVWKLDKVASVNGHEPEVLGAPQVTEETVSGRALRFDGESDGLVFPVNPLANWTTFTIEVLFMPEVNGASAQRFMHIEDDSGSRILMETRLRAGKSWALDTYLHSANGKDDCPLLDTTKLHPVGRWAWVALVYDGKMMTHYVNGVREMKGEVVFKPMTRGRISLGVRLNRVFWFKGCIEEVRFRPTALAPESLQRLPE